MLNAVIEGATFSLVCCLTGDVVAEITRRTDAQLRSLAIAARQGCFEGVDSIHNSVGLTLNDLLEIYGGDPCVDARWIDVRVPLR